MHRYYYMFGSTIGSLGVDAKVGKHWQTWFMVSGQRQTSDTQPWSKGDIVLPAHATHVRFMGERGAGYTGDICIDQVDITAVGNEPA